jgi:ferredoxin-NADP reductase/ferredoxin
MFEIKLRTRDAVELDVICPPGATVLEAAEAAGLFLPSMCREGSCGQCNAEVTTGAYSLAPGASPTASAAEIPLCRCRPEGKLDVALPYLEAAIMRHKAPTRQARIESIEAAGSGAVALSLVLEPDAELGQAADFTPGQYIELTAPGTEIRRAYSMANLPNWDGRLDLLIRLAPGGAFSTWLAESARVGDVMSARGPLGGFVLDESSPRPRMLVGGGCGLAPLLSMLRHLADFGDMQETHLIFGANTEDELFAPELIAPLQDQLPQFAATYAVWRPGPDWAGFAGNAAEALDAQLAAMAEMPDIYICGPPRLVEAVQACAAKHGVPADQVFSEEVDAPKRAA